MKQGIKNIISSLAIVATIGAIWMWGYSVGSGNNTALVDLVKEDRDKLKSQVTQLLKEAESLKIQLSANINNSQNTIINSPILSNEPDIDSDKKDSSSDKKDNILRFEERTIQIQNTKPFFDGNLEITLIATNFSGSPLRHKVFANVLIPGSKPFEIRDADPGSAFIVGDFQIVIVNTGGLSATFKVFKILKQHVN